VHKANLCTLKCPQRPHFDRIFILIDVPLRFVWPHGRMRAYVCVRAADTTKAKKQSQQKNRVDVAGVLGAGGGTDVRRALPTPHPAPAPPPRTVEVTPTSTTEHAPLVSLGASKPDGYTGGARQGRRAVARLDGAKGKAAAGKKSKGAERAGRRRRNRRRPAREDGSE
jgi:hypothetical protein